MDADKREEERLMRTMNRAGRANAVPNRGGAMAARGGMAPGRGTAAAAPVRGGMRGGMRGGAVPVVRSGNVVESEMKGLNERAERMRQLGGAAAMNSEAGRNRMGEAMKSEEIEMMRRKQAEAAKE